MNLFNRLPGNFSRWILLLFLGLLFESCLLVGLAGVYLARRGDLALPFIRPEPGLVETSVYPAPQAESPQGQEPPAVTIPTQPASSSGSNPPTRIPEPSTEPLEEPTAWEFPPRGKIVYVCYDGSFDQLCLMNSDGSGQRQLTDVRATNFYPSLSPDGDQVVFSSNRDGNFEIFRLDLRSGELSQLTDGLGSLYAPEISPNGNRIIFTNESGGAQNIWIMRSDGGNARPLTDSGLDIDPTWSPSGEQIAFSSARNGPRQLFVMNSNGENERPLLLGEELKIGGRISWSPDGAWLAFYAGQAPERDIYLVSSDGGPVFQLTNGGDNLGPSFSPGSDWLAFTSYRDGNNEIYVMRLDGSNQARLTRSRLSDWQPRWGR